VLQATSYSKAKVEESDLVNSHFLFKATTVRKALETMAIQVEIVTRPKMRRRKFRL